MKNNYIEETHEYFINKELVPSVTQIANPISFEKRNKLDKIMIEQRSKIGIKVHEYICEFFIIGQFDFENIENECLPYIYSFLQWYKCERPKVIFSERLIFNEKDMYGGTLDLYCEIQGEYWIIDFKTTSIVDKDSLSVQLEGYKRELTKKYQVYKCGYVQLKSDQKYVFKDIETDKEWFDCLLIHAKKMIRKRKIIKGE